MNTLQIFLPRIIFTVLVFLIFMVLRISLKKIIIQFADKSYRLQKRTKPVVKILNFTALFLFVVALLFVWGINFKDFGLFISSVFAVIGIAMFAQWSILSNITSGVIMFFTFPYRIDDFIKIHDGDNSIYGHIEDIKTFHVVIKTPEGEMVTFPNSLMLQKGVSVLNKKNIEKYLESLNFKSEEADLTGLQDL